MKKLFLIWTLFVLTNIVKSQVNIGKNVVKTTADSISITKALFQYTKHPAAVLPDTIAIATGTTLNIYYDELVQNGSSNFAFYPVCTKGGNMSNRYGFTPATTDVGVTALTINIYNAGTVDIVQTVSTKLKVVAAGTGSETDTMFVCFMGNSLTENSDSTFIRFNQLVADSTGTKAVMVGTQDAGATKREGYSGQGFAFFIGATSPFYNVSALDFDNWFYVKCGQQADDSLDMLFIELGTNDIWGTTILSAASIETIITRAKTLLTALWSDFPTCEVAIMMPPQGNSNIDAWGNNYLCAYNKPVFERNMHALWIAFKNNFGSNAYNKKVVVSPNGLLVDRVAGYPAATNALHPLGITGYYKLADSWYSTFKWLLLR